MIIRLIRYDRRHCGLNKKYVRVTAASVSAGYVTVTLMTSVERPLNRRRIVVVTNAFGKNSCKPALRALPRPVPLGGTPKISSPMGYSAKFDRSTSNGFSLYNEHLKFALSG